MKEPREETSMMTRIDRWLLLVICATAIPCALPYDVSRHRLKSSKYSPFPIPSKIHQEMSSQHLVRPAVGFYPFAAMAI